MHRPRILVALAVLLLLPSAVAAQQTLRIAADTSMAHSITDLAAAFERESGDSVRVSLGSSRELARQIQHGAPYTLFLAADADQVEALAEEGVIDDVGTVYARSGLVLHVRRGAPVRADDGLEGLGEALRGQRLGRVVIPDPASSPHGRAARESLQELGLWGDLQDHVSYAPNAVQALRRVDGGPPQLAILPEPLTRRHRFGAGGTTTTLPGDLHAPVEHVSVPLDDDDESPAAAFDAFLQGEEGQGILEDYGFQIPPFE